MIKLENLTPEVYYKQSRDFQLIGRLFELIINYIKTNVDTVYNYPYSANVDTYLIDLITLLLGFKSKHNYNTKSLMALCGAFSEILKNKGNIEAIQLAGQTLLNAEGITENFGVTIDSSKNSPTLLVFIPLELQDINLFQDLLPYILPAGISCTIIRQIQDTRSAETKLKYSDNLWYNWKIDTETSFVPEPTQEGLDSPSTRDIPGFISTSTVVQQPEPSNDSEN